MSRARLDTALWPELADHHREHVEFGRPMVGCERCVAAGVMLCPGCLLPSRSGRHTRCVTAGAWLRLVLLILSLAGCFTFVVWVAATNVTATQVLALAFLAACLGWPYRLWFAAHLRR